MNDETKIANILQGIDAEEILKKLEIEFQITSNDELAMVCPNPLHHDTNASLFLNRKDLCFNCFGCDWQGNILTFISLVKNIKFNETLEWLQGFNFFDYKQLLYNKLYKRIHYKALRPEENPFYIPPTIDIDSDDDNINKFFKKRHLSYRIARFYAMRYCEMGFYKKRMIIPILHNKKLYGFEGRLMESPKENENKCRYPPKSTIKSIIYDIDMLDINKPLYFTEGLMDCLSLKSRGYLHSSCSFGSKITRKQNQILMGFKEILLIPDSDKGGDEFIATFKNNVKGPVIKIIQLPVGKDIDEIGTRELYSIISKKDHVILNQ